MKILAIETSCDETGVAVIEASGNLENPSFCVLGNSLLSQALEHRKYGGVYPNLAKRLHAKNLIPLLKEALREAGMLHINSRPTPSTGASSVLASLPALPSRQEAMAKRAGQATND